MKKLYEQRTRLINQMTDLNSRVETEKREMTSDEVVQWDKLDTEVIELTAQINRANKLKGYEGFSDTPAGEGEKKNLLPTEDEILRKLTHDKDGDGNAVALEKIAMQKAKNVAKEMRSAFTNYIRRGEAGLTDKNRQALGEYQKRQQLKGTDNVGGYLVPDEWNDTLIQAMEYFGGMLVAPKQLVRSTGRDLHVPKTLFAGGGSAAVLKGALVAEAVADSVSDIIFGETIVSMYLYTSGLIQASYEMLQDDDFDIEGIIRDTAADRVGRIVNEHLTTGTGSSQPKGVMVASTEGFETAANNAITYAEWIDFEHGVNSAYRSRANPKCGFMFNDNTLAVIKKLTIGAADSRPLWVPSMREGEPDRILGYRYWINDDIADIATDALVAAFGDWSKYYAIRAKDMTLVRSDHRYVEKRLVAFFMYARYGGDLVDLHAVKHLKMAT